MKINLPITQKNIPFPSGRYLVTRTDLKGKIVDCNDAFIEISGFDKQELVGSSHNIVRHPDMPPQAFAQMWNRLKAGYPWRGLVKNRCKNGDHYWVEAVVVPVRKNGEVIGYLSVRSAPQPQAVQDAEALYAKLIAQPNQKLSSSARGLAAISLRTKIWCATALSVVSLVAGTGIGMWGIHHSNETLGNLHDQSMIPLNVINEVVLLMGENRSQIALSLQHESSSPFATLHDHPVAMHIDEVQANRERITALLQQLATFNFDPVAQEKISAWAEMRKRYVNEGLNPALAALKQGAYLEANKILLEKVNPIYRNLFEMNRDLVKLFDLQADANHQSEKQIFQIIFWLGSLGSALTILLTLFINLLILRRVNQGLRSSQKALSGMAEGDLSQYIDVNGHDELGNIENGLAEMQVHMQVMIDDITQTVKLLDDRTGTLQTTLSEMLARFGRRASDVSAISAAIEEMSQSIIGVSNNAYHATGAAEEARNAAETGTQKMEVSRKATSEAGKAMHEARETISELSTAVAQIGRMTETIREIADQTNLLALNAAIEAARAGESGRGFAVVADEVRKLAERTGQSTQEINNIVANVGSVTQASVDAINEVESRSQMSGAQLDATAEDLIHILDLSRTVNSMMSDIAQTNQEQSTVSGELAERMAKISNSLETSNVDIRAAEDLLEELRQEAQDLNKMIEHFKT